MFGGIFGRFLALIFAFSMGVSFASEQPATDSELKQKVQQHMDVIADESAAIVDDVFDEARKDERVQKAEEFANDVNEIVGNTKQDIKDHFGPEEETEDLSEAVGLEEATEGI